MGILVTTKFGVPAETVEKVVVLDGTATMAATSEDGRRHGTIHHQFVQDPDGSAVVVDEWPDVEPFHRFFADQQDMRTIMERAGVTEPPEVTIYPVLDTPDRF